MRCFQLGLAVLVLTAVCFFSGCATEYYGSGKKVGRIPKADWNVNGIIFGARGSDKDTDRHTVWSLLFDYDSFGDGSSFKMLGPLLPNLFGWIDMEGETGFVTPIYSQHWGNSDSWAVGPLALPIFRYDSYGDDWACYFLCLFQFNSEWGYSMIPLGGSEKSPKPIFSKGVERGSREPDSSFYAGYADGWEW